MFARERKVCGRDHLHTPVAFAVSTSHQRIIINTTPLATVIFNLILASIKLTAVFIVPRRLELRRATAALVDIDRCSLTVLTYLYNDLQNHSSFLH